MAGNANSGPKREKPFLDALRMEIKDAGSDHKRLRKIARNLLAAAEGGDLMAIKEVADRLDGKPSQAVESHNIHEYVFAEVPPTDSAEQWKQSLDAAAGARKPVLNPH